MHLSANPILHLHTKHVEIDIYFVSDLVQQKKVRIHHLPTTAQLADVLTKPLSTTKFLPLKDKLNVYSSHHAFTFCFAVVIALFISFHTLLLLFKEQCADHFFINNMHHFVINLCYHYEIFQTYPVKRQENQTVRNMIL